MSNPLFKFDTSALELATRQLVAENGKDLATAFNKKMGWMLRRWLWLTPKADKNVMARKLGLQMKLYQSGEKTTKSGKKLKFKGGWKIKGAAKKGNSTTKTGASIPMIFSILSKRKSGSPFKGRSRSAGRKAMAKAVKKKIGARLKSISYLKSAIATAQKPFLSYSSGSNTVPQDNSSSLKPVGRPKGFGTLATAGNKVVAVAVNKAMTKRQGDKGLMKYALPALQKAYADELADTQAFLEKELRKTAQRLSIKTR